MKTTINKIEALKQTEIHINNIDNSPLLPVNYVLAGGELKEPCHFGKKHKWRGRYISFADEYLDNSKPYDGNIMTPAESQEEVLMYVLLGALQKHPLLEDDGREERFYNFRLVVVSRNAHFLQALKLCLIPDESESPIGVKPKLREYLKSLRSVKTAIITDELCKEIREL